MTTQWNNTGRRAAPDAIAIVRIGGLFILALIAISSLASCEREKGDTTASATAGGAFEIEKTSERGPVTLAVKASRKEITTADRVTLLLDARAKEDYEVEFPKFGEKLEEFRVLDCQTPPSKLGEDGAIVHQRQVELEPFLAGDYKIPPMKVAFWKKGEKDKKHEVESKELTIKVASVLPDQAQAKLKDIAPPVDLPRLLREWLYVIGPVLALAGLGAFLLWRRRRRIEAEPERRLLPHEIAYRELEELLAEGLIEKGLKKIFYQRLSDILRHYIEMRFGLHAPERTTEEFMEDLRGSDVLATPHKNLLKVFLNHCDLVKFAEHQPGHGEIGKAVESCRAFIKETEPVVEPAGAREEESETCAAPVATKAA